MKKVFYVFAAILAVVVVGIFFINGHQDDVDVTKEKTKVGFLLNGTCDDKNYGQAHYEGIEKVAETLNLEILYKENVPETEECTKMIEELIGEGCEIIICNSFGFGEWELKAAEQHPEIYFFHTAGTQYAHNLSTYFGRMYQVRYLSGIVAGLQTETNEIGYVAAFPISEVNRGINAFTLGVKKVNPEATIYVEWTNSWIDDELTKEATEKLLANHNIDVITMHTDSLEALKLAEEHGIWSIGYNMDNSKDFPNTFLTAPIWRWENFYEPYILDCLQGKFVGKVYWEGIETGIVALAPFTNNVKGGIEKIVKEEQKELESLIVDVFYGPIVDQNGTIRVQQGESMTDDVMLNQFDWYVEGVVIDE